MHAGVLTLLIAAGCAAEGTVLREWTLDVDGGVQQQHVTLPASLATHMPFAEVDYTLRTSVALQPEQRGRPLALLLDCFHGPIALSVDGVDVADAGTGSNGGSWRFVVAPSQTQRDALELTLRVHRDSANTLGFGTAPRLVDRVDGDSRWRGIAMFNRVTAIACAGFLFMLGVLYGALALLDRSRVEYKAMVAYSIGTAGVPLLQLGIQHALFGEQGTLVQIALTLIGITGMIHFIHHTFELGPASRWWIRVNGGYAVLALACGISFQTMMIASVLFLPLMLAGNGYVFVRIARLARRGVHRIDARIMIGGYVFACLCMLQGIAWFAMGWSPLGGIHPLPMAVAIATAAQALILGRQHAARQRAIERANAELQRQVAERSRELGEALAKLAQQPAPSPSPGRVIDGRYRVVRELGAGGMGTVFEVERSSDGGRFALKTLRTRGDTEQLARFAREAQIAAELRHPHLVPVLDVGIADDGLFLVMPLVDGGSLEQQRTKFGDARWATPLLAQIASGLAALHERAIIHRDLKPANVLIAAGTARIADFGLASLEREVRAAPSPGRVVPVAVSASDATMTGVLHRGAEAPPRSDELTEIGDVFGTPSYMAPELAAGVHQVVASSDVYAFGLIACEMLTGEKAFATPPLVLRLGGKPIPPPPADLPAWVARCLDVDPAKRPTAAALAEELV